MRTLSRAVLLFVSSLLAVSSFAQNVGVTKSGPSSATPGSSVVYTVTVFSNGVTIDPNTEAQAPADATNVVLNDNIPEGMTFVSATQDSGPAFSCSTPQVGSGGSINCTIATLPYGTSAQFSFAMAIPGDAAPATTWTNVATVTADINGLDEDDSAAAATSTPSNAADVAVTKNGPDGAAPGSDVTYTIVVASNGPAAAQNVELSDTLPGDMTFVSVSQSGAGGFTCTTPAVGSGGTVSCTIASMAAGTSTTFTLVGHIPNTAISGTTYNNTAAVTSANDPTPENNSAFSELTISSADLSIMKSGPTTATAGQQITYSITFTNNGPDTAAGPAWGDNLPAGTTFASLTQDTGAVSFSCVTPAAGNPGTVSCSAAGMPSTATATFTLVANIDPNYANGGTLTNTAVTSSDTFDPNPNNNTSSTSAVVTGFTDLSVTKTATPTAVAGNNITYTITVRNNGPNPGLSTALTDTLPAGTTFVSLNQSSGPAFSCTTGATINCTNASFASGATAVFSLVIHTASSATGSVSNTANVSSSTSELNPGNNSSTANVTLSQSADLSVMKSGPALIAPNTDVTYTIVVSNAGPSDASAVTLTDSVPANTTFVSASGSGFTCSTPPVGGTGAVSCTMPSLAAGANATLTLVVHTSGSFGGTITNTANVSSTTPDPNGLNNSATASGSQTVADLAITKASTTAPSGTTGAFLINVTNNGPSTASTVTMTDVVPANASFASITQTAGPTFTCTTPAAGATGTISCTIGTLTAGTPATFKVVFNATVEVPQLTNTASVSTVTVDPNPANNSATAITPVLQYIPALSPAMLMLLALAITAIGAMILRR